MHTPASGFLFLPAIFSALAARLFEQIHVLNFNRFVERLGHVVDGQRGDGPDSSSLGYACLRSANSSITTTIYGIVSGTCAPSSMTLLSESFFRAGASTFLWYDSTSRTF